MDNYLTTKALDISKIGVEVPIGTIISKFASKIDSMIGSLEWDDEAFYQWIGSPGSLTCMNFTGSIPDPSSIIAISGSIPLTMGQDYYNFTGAGFWFSPQVAVVTLAKPTPTSDNLFTVLREGTLSTDGFTVDFSSPIPTTGYLLEYVVFQ